MQAGLPIQVDKTSIFADSPASQDFLPIQVHLLKEKIIQRSPFRNESFAGLILQKWADHLWLVHEKEGRTVPSIVSVQCSFAIKQWSAWKDCAGIINSMCYLMTWDHGNAQESMAAMGVPDELRISAKVKKGNQNRANKPCWLTKACLLCWGQYFLKLQP